MLAWAGTGVAVANAHPAALAAADEVTASNDADGVARWLERALPPAGTRRRASTAGTVLAVPPALRQRAVLEGIVARAAVVEAVEGLIVIGSFAGGRPDALSDLDLLAVARPGQLEAAWAAGRQLAGDAFLIWEPQPRQHGQVRWVNWLTHDLVKVECGFAAPGSRPLAEPFAVVSGPATLADSFPRIDMSVVEEQAERRRELQRDVGPETLTPEELLGWKLAELKAAARALLRRVARPG